MDVVEQTVYYTHDNGRRPYKVEIVGGRVFVYSALEQDLDSDIVTYSPHAIIGIGAEKILIGKSPIIDYMSPVGNNDTPYPYAICHNGDILLMSEKVRLVNPRIPQNEDPYTYYYSISYITGPDGEPGRGNIEKTYVGNSTFSMNYVVNPSEDYDKLVRNGGNEELGGPISFKMKVPNTLFQVTKDQYIDIIEQFGRQNGITPINIQWLLGL
jgi:hypothetical protein